MWYTNYDDNRKQYQKNMNRFRKQRDDLIEDVKGMAYEAEQQAQRIAELEAELAETEQALINMAKVKHEVTHKYNTVLEDFAEANYNLANVNENLKREMKYIINKHEQFNQLAMDAVPKYLEWLTADADEQALLDGTDESTAPASVESSEDKPRYIPLDGRVFDTKTELWYTGTFPEQWAKSKKLANVFFYSWGAKRTCIFLNKADEAE